MTPSESLGVTKGVTLCKMVLKTLNSLPEGQFFFFLERHYII